MPNYEDFIADYTELDPSSKITRTSPKTSWVAISDNEEAWVYRDKGAAYFAFFTHQFEIEKTSGGPMDFAFWALTNTVDSLLDIYYADGDEEFLYVQASGDLRLAVIKGGVGTYDAYTGFSAGTKYYITIERTIYTDSTNRRTRVYIRTGSHEGDLVDTLTVNTFTYTTSYQYIFSFNHLKKISGQTVTGFTQNLTLDPYTICIAGSFTTNSTVAGALEVTREFIGSTSGQSSVSGALSASKPFSGSIVVNSTIGGLLRRTREIAGLTIATLSSISGTLKSTREVIGTITVQGGLDGLLTRFRGLVGSTTASSVISGTIKIIQAVSRTTNFKSTFASNLTVTSCVGTITTTSSIVGSLSRSCKLVGTAAVSSTIDGVLTVSFIGLPIVCTSTLVGSLSASKKLITAFATTSSTVGSVKVRRELQGTIAPSSGFDGLIRTIVKLTVIVTTQSTVSGLLLKMSVETLSGALSCSCTISGPLTISRELVTTVVTQSGFAAPLSVTRTLITTITVTSTFAASLVNQLLIIGSLTVQSTTSGAISVKRTFIVLVACSGNISGSLSRLNKLVGTFSAQSVISGQMPVFAIPSFIRPAVVKITPIFTSSTRVNARLKRNVVELT